MVLVVYFEHVKLLSFSFDVIDRNVVDVILFLTIFHHEKFAHEAMGEDQDVHVLELFVSQQDLDGIFDPLLELLVGVMLAGIVEGVLN